MVLVFIKEGLTFIMHNRENQEALFQSMFSMQLFVTGEKKEVQDFKVQKRILRGQVYQGHNN